MDKTGFDGQALTVINVEKTSVRARITLHVRKESDKKLAWDFRKDCQPFLWSYKKQRTPWAVTYDSIFTAVLMTWSSFTIQHQMVREVRLHAYYNFAIILIA